MDAIKLLKEQHDEVEALFDKFEKTDDVNEKEECFAKIGDRLAAHAAIEEKIFYPEAYRAGEEGEDEEVEEMLREAVEEHLAIKRVIADLLEMDASDENYEAKMKVLRDEFEHHVEEEEGELFPEARKAIDGERLEEMGIEMKEIFEALIPSEPRLEIPNETETAAPLD